MEINNPLNWSIVYTNQLNAVPIRENNQIIGYLPMVDLIIPIVLHNPIIAVDIKTLVPVGRLWRYAGKMSRVVDFALGEAFSSDERKFLFLNRWNICLFDERLTDYRVVYSPPRWFISLNISVYQFEGNVDLPFNFLKILKSDITDIKEHLGI